MPYLRVIIASLLVLISGPALAITLEEEPLRPQISPFDQTDPNAVLQRPGLRGNNQIGFGDAFMEGQLGGSSLWQDQQGQRSVLDPLDLPEILPKSIFE